MECDLNWKVIHFCFKDMGYTLYIVIDGTSISTFCFKVDLSENHLSYINKWYLIF